MEQQKQTMDQDEGSPPKTPTKTTAEERPKEPPSPAAKLLTRRALSGKGSKKKGKSKTKTPQVNVSGAQSSNSSVNLTFGLTDSTLSDSGYQKITSQPGWWQDLGKSLQNVSLSKLVSAEGEDSMAMTEDSLQFPTPVDKKPRTAVKRVSTSQFHGVMDITQISDKSTRSSTLSIAPEAVSEESEQSDSSTETPVKRRKRLAHRISKGVFIEAVGSSSMRVSNSPKQSLDPQLETEIDERHSIESPSILDIAMKERRNVKKVSMSLFKSAAEEVVDLECENQEPDVAEQEQTDSDTEASPVAETSQKRRRVKRVSSGNFDVGMDTLNTSDSTKSKANSSPETHDDKVSDIDMPEVVDDKKKRVQPLAAESFTAAMNNSESPASNQSGHSSLEKVPQENTSLLDMTIESPPVDRSKSRVQSVTAESFTAALNNTESSVKNQSGHSSFEETPPENTSLQDMSVESPPINRSKSRVQSVTAESFTAALNHSESSVQNQSGHTSMEEVPQENISLLDLSTDSPPINQSKSRVQSVTAESFSAALNNFESSVKNQSGHTSLEELLEENTSLQDMSVESPPINQSKSRVQSVTAESFSAALTSSVQNQSGHTSLEETPSLQDMSVESPPINRSKSRVQSVTAESFSAALTSSVQNQSGHTSLEETPSLQDTSVESPPINRSKSRVQSVTAESFTAAMDSSESSVNNQSWHASIEKVPQENTSLQDMSIEKPPSNKRKRSVKPVDTSAFAETEVQIIDEQQSLNTSIVHPVRRSGVQSQHDMSSEVSPIIQTRRRSRELVDMNVVTMPTPAKSPAVSKISTESSNTTELCRTADRDSSSPVLVAKSSRDKRGVKPVTVEMFSDLMDESVGSNKSLALPESQSSNQSGSSKQILSSKKQSVNIQDRASKPSFSPVEGQKLLAKKQRVRPVSMGRFARSLDTSGASDAAENASHDSHSPAVQEASNSSVESIPSPEKVPSKRQKKKISNSVFEQAIADKTFVVDNPVIVDSSPAKSTRRSMKDKVSLDKDRSSCFSDKHNESHSSVDSIPSPEKVPQRKQKKKISIGTFEQAMTDKTFTVNSPVDSTPAKSTRKSMKEKVSLDKDKASHSSIAHEASNSSVDSVPSPEMVPQRKQTKKISIDTIEQEMADKTFSVDNPIIVDSSPAKSTRKSMKEKVSLDKDKASHSSIAHESSKSSVDSIRSPENVPQRKQTKKVSIGTFEQAIADKTFSVDSPVDSSPAKSTRKSMKDKVSLDMDRSSRFSDKHNESHSSVESIPSPEKVPQRKQKKKISIGTFEQAMADKSFIINNPDLTDNVNSSPAKSTRKSMKDKVSLDKDRSSRFSDKHNESHSSVDSIPSPEKVPQRKQKKKISIGTFEQAMTDKTFTVNSPVIVDSSPAKSTRKSMKEKVSLDKDKASHSSIAHEASNSSVDSVRSPEMVPQRKQTKKISIGTFEQAMAEQTFVVNRSDTEDVVSSPPSKSTRKSVKSMSMSIHEKSMATIHEGLELVEDIELTQRTPNDSAKKSRESLSAFAKGGSVRHSFNPSSKPQTRVSTITLDETTIEEQMEGTATLSSSRTTSQMSSGEASTSLVAFRKGGPVRHSFSPVMSSANSASLDNVLTKVDTPTPQRVTRKSLVAFQRHGPVRHSESFSQPLPPMESSSNTRDSSYMDISTRTAESTDPQLVLSNSSIVDPTADVSKHSSILDESNANSSLGSVGTASPKHAANKKRVREVNLSTFQQFMESESGEDSTSEISDQNVHSVTINKSHSGNASKRLSKSTQENRMSTEMSEINNSRVSKRRSNTNESQTENTFNVSQKELSNSEKRKSTGPSDTETNTSRLSIRKSAANSTQLMSEQTLNISQKTSSIREKRKSTETEINNLRVYTRKSVANSSQLSEQTLNASQKESSAREKRKSTEPFATELNNSRLSSRNSAANSSQLMSERTANTSQRESSSNRKIHSIELNENELEYNSENSTINKKPRIDQEQETPTEGVSNEKSTPIAETNKENEVEFTPIEFDLALNTMQINAVSTAKKLFDVSVSELSDRYSMSDFKKAFEMINSPCISIDTSSVFEQSTISQHNKGGDTSTGSLSTSVAQTTVLESPSKNTRSSALKLPSETSLRRTSQKTNTPYQNKSLFSIASFRSTKSYAHKRYTLVDLQSAIKSVRSPSDSLHSPGSNDVKFSIRDFEKAVSSLKQNTTLNTSVLTSSSLKSSLSQRQSKHGDQTIRASTARQSSSSTDPHLSLETSTFPSEQSIETRDVTMIENQDNAETTLADVSHASSLSDSSASKQSKKNFVKPVSLSQFKNLLSETLDETQGHNETITLEDSKATTVHNADSNTTEAGDIETSTRKSKRLSLKSTSRTSSNNTVVGNVADASIVSAKSRPSTTSVSTRSSHILTLDASSSFLQITEPSRKSDAPDDNTHTETMSRKSGAAMVPVNSSRRSKHISPRSNASTALDEIFPELNAVSATSAPDDSGESSQEEEDMQVAESDEESSQEEEETQVAASDKESSQDEEDMQVAESDKESSQEEEETQGAESEKESSDEEEATQVAVSDKESSQDEEEEEDIQGVESEKENSDEKEETKVAESPDEEEDPQGAESDKGSSDEEGGPQGVESDKEISDEEGDPQVAESDKESFDEKEETKAAESSDEEGDPQGAESDKESSDEGDQQGAESDKESSDEGDSQGAESDKESSHHLTDDESAHSDMATTESGHLADKSASINVTPEANFSGIHPTSSSRASEKSVSSVDSTAGSGAKRDLTRAFAATSRVSALSHTEPAASISGLPSNRQSSQPVNWMDYKTMLQKQPIEITKKRPQSQNTTVPMKKTRAPKRSVPIERMVDGAAFKLPRRKRNKPWVTNKLCKKLETHFAKRDSFSAGKITDDFITWLSDKVTEATKPKSDAHRIAQRIAKNLKKYDFIENDYDFYLFCNEYLPQAFCAKIFTYPRKKILD